MENQLDKNFYIAAGDAFNKEGVVNDLNSYLSAIKGRTYLIKHSIHDSHPIQKHLNEIIHCIDESISSANLLSGYFMESEDG